MIEVMMIDASSDKKHLDITKPGIAPVSHTSKPALVAPQQLAQDPMMRKPQEQSSDLSVIEHQDIGLKPTISKSDIEDEQSDNESKATDKDNPDIIDENKDEDLPKGVIEKKNPINDQQTEKLKELIDKKTYYLPIQSTPQKTLLKIVVILLIICVVLVICGLFIFIK